ncbi:TPA: hypothetical protein PI096_001724 [Staphylococcus aureus]|nr:hypothetical protein [Staphylococcus aureus]HDH4218906.1 hypothetical protein [Staphylococcus aureus]HDH4286512.1 hypothetical protein [Staphylococcus aureus]HDH4311311.1 hypothetical protein [Staphylococcus aureus]HDH4313047.1 hypothetical protein [Staphylococcus aureus]
MNYDTGFQLSVMDARLKKMRKQRDEYKKQRDELIGDIGKLREKQKAFDEIDNLIYEVFEMMNCFKCSFINENKELILDSESNIYFSLKDCANKLDLVVKFIHWVSRCCIENMSSKRTQAFLQAGFEQYIGKCLTINDYEYMYRCFGNGLNSDGAYSYARRLLNISEGIQ